MIDRIAIRCLQCLRAFAGIAALATVPGHAQPDIQPSGQPQPWIAMDIDMSAVRDGEVAGYYLVRADFDAPGAGSGLSELAASLPGVAASRAVAGGANLNGATYSVVRLTSAAAAADLNAAVLLHNGLSISPILVGQATSDSPFPDDPMIGNQYAIQNDGQVVAGVQGQVGADVRVARAWDLQRGSAQVRIAVIDSGVSATHPDLMSKLDDGVNVTGGQLSDTDAPYNTHGTHIAGIVAASTNNSQGVVGVSWGSRIVPIKAANPLGFTSDVWLAEGLVWAADSGVDVAVISFGLNSPSDVLADAVRYAFDRGVIVCASAGNNGTEGVLYPAAYQDAIAVGATDNADRLASFSSFGPEVEVVAPGVDILSTRHTIFEPHTYGYESGTSMSTPIVAGVAALLRSASPEISVSEVRAVLAMTSRDFGLLGRDDEYGYGRVNAHRALQQVLGIPWCYADVDGNGIVQPTDFSTWIAIYSSGDLRADQNRNGTVEPADFNAFVLNYGVQQHGCDSN